MKPKVLVIFPQGGKKQSSHYPYWLELFSAAKNTLDLKMLIETEHSLAGRFTQILIAARQGYCNVYIHYSYSAVVMSKIVSLFHPMKIYYWNCEKYEYKATDPYLPTILKLVDVLVTGSSSLADNYRKVFRLGNKPIKVVSNWVSKPQSRGTHHLLRVMGNPNILFVHHLSPRKGSRELPIIIKDVVKQIPQVRFHIVGDGPDFKWLKEYATDHTLPVTLYSSLPLEKTTALFQLCDYFIMPSRSEGFPRVILEAMINKIPLVATKVGNVDEIVSSSQQQWLVPPGKPRQFATMLIKLIKSKNKHRAINENYVRVSKEYTKNKATTAFVQLF